MRVSRVLEQHIAVFGESGSGKTVLVSSFYGAMQEPEFLQSSLFDVTADDPGQGHRLHANYLGMKDDARLPEATRFSSIPYAFSLKLKDKSGKDRRKPFDALRLVWHDYPGEWFEQDVSGPAEAERRTATFRALLGSDVALLLVDGQKLLDYAGEEERYLKSLFSSYRTGLLRLKEQVLDGGKPLVRFPRIWAVAVSKADLLPDLDVYGLRDLVIGKAADDLAELRKTLAGFIESPEALSVGEDFLRLSSAKFEPNKIEVADRIGVDLVIPMAAMLPFERHIRWAKMREAGTKVIEELLEGVGPMAAAMLGKIQLASRFAGPKAVAAYLAGRKGAGIAADIGMDQLRSLNASALAKHDHLAAALTRFALDLEQGEEKRVLLMSRR